jgi:hypothetical protein
MGQTKFLLESLKKKQIGVDRRTILKWMGPGSRSIVIDYELYDRGSISGRGERFSS